MPLESGSTPLQKHMLLALDSRPISSLPPASMDIQIKAQLTAIPLLLLGNMSSLLLQHHFLWEDKPLSFPHPFPSTSSIKISHVTLPCCSWLLPSLWYFIAAVSPFNTKVWAPPGSAVSIFFISPQPGLLDNQQVHSKYFTPARTEAFTEASLLELKSINTHTPLLSRCVLAIFVGNSRFRSRKQENQQDRWSSWDV